MKRAKPDQPLIGPRSQTTVSNLRFTQLSPARQALVRLLQTVNYGQIQELLVRDGSPIFEPAPVVIINAKLYRDDGPRPELALADFVLRDGVLRLMTRLDDLRNGTIQCINVRARPATPRCPSVAVGRIALTGCRVSHQSAARPWPPAISFRENAPHSVIYSSWTGTTCCGCSTALPKLTYNSMNASK